MPKTEFEEHVRRAPLQRNFWIAGCLAIAVASADQLMAEEPAPKTGNADRPVHTAGAPENGDAIRKAGDPLVIDLGQGITLDMVWIPPGEFIMGCTNEEAIRLLNDDKKHGYGYCDGMIEKYKNGALTATQRKVTLTRGFWMAKYELTEDIYALVNGAERVRKSRRAAPLRGNQGWQAADEFIRKLNSLKVTEGTFRMPTEAEWEYACRAGTTTAFHFGDDIDHSMARFEYSAVERNALGIGVSPKDDPVGSYPPNAWGLHDMHGNLGEHCSDFVGPYSGEDVTNPPPARLDEAWQKAHGEGQKGHLHACRGGGWHSHGKTGIRSAAGPVSACHGGGALRLVLEPDRPAK